MAETQLPEPPLQAGRCQLDCRQRGVAELSPSSAFPDSKELSASFKCL